MKLCQSCGQELAEDITTCPVCGNKVPEGRKTIDDYRIIDVLSEGYATILCRAVKQQTDELVMIRIFSPLSGVDEKIAQRLKNELEELKKLPEEYFVRHFEIRQSSDGLWYRVSEWLDTENWGNLIASGVFQDYRIAFRLFYRIVCILEGLHRIALFIPHLILEDIMVVKADGGELEIKIDYKYSRFFDPKLDRPGPMLKKLLSCHPDIINQRPLDFRSDIWSLGKIFVELLTAKHDSPDFEAEIDSLPLPSRIAVLLKSMLADEPGLRPQSMSEVAESFSKLTEKEIQSAMRAMSNEQVPRSRIGWFYKGIKTKQLFSKIFETTDWHLRRPVKIQPVSSDEKQTSHVFISYIQENDKYVQQLCDELTKNGVKVWLDRKDIKPGVRWKNAIRQAIKEGDFFIACFSKEYSSRDKTFMNEELSLAIDELRLHPIGRAWFIPVLLSKCDIPSYDIGGGETLQDIQWVPLYEHWDSGIQRILSAIKPLHP